MAKSKPKGRAAAAEKPGGRAEYVQVRMTAAFKEWLASYAESRNLTISDTMVQAVLDDAERRGFSKPPRR